MPAQKRSRETLQKEDGDALLQQQLDHTNSSNSHEQKQQPQGDTGDDGGGRADERTCLEISKITTNIGSHFVHFVLDSITIIWLSLFPFPLTESDRSQSSSSINEDVKEE